MRLSVEEFTFTKMVNLRDLFVNLKGRLSNLYHSVKSYLNYESNRCLELILICAGIHPIPGPEPWKRRCLTLYRLLGFYQFIVSLSRAGFSIYNQDEIMRLYASFFLAVSVVTCLVKVNTLKHYQEVVQQAKVFVDSNFATSGDPDYDASSRQYAARTSGKASLAIFLLFCMDQTIMMIPSTTRDIICCIPKQFHLVGPMAARFLQETYNLFLIIIWGNRYFCYSLSMLPVLMGLRSELKIVARDYETIQNRLQDQISDDHNNVVGSSWNQLSQMLRLKQTMGSTLEQHVEVLRNIKLVQNAVNTLYAITHYSAMLMISICVLLAIKSENTFISVMLFSSGAANVLECYFWSYLIESMEDIMELIAGSAAELGTRLEYSPEHHSEYIQMKTSLMIIQINASRREWFSCGGIFSISVEAAGDLCMNIYRFTTFLLKFD